MLATRLCADPAAKDFHVFVGALDHDRGHRIYVTPPLSPREMVQAFGVGGHGGHDAESADRDVGKRLEAANAICPFIITFVDSAGLHAEFTRHLDAATATKIEKLYDGASIESGLESYKSEWSGDGPMMAPALVAEQGLRLWWD